MIYRVDLLPHAERDLGRNYAWLAERSMAGADAWMRALRAKLESLERNPYQFGLAPEADTSNVEVRQFLFKTRRGRVYRGLFVIDGDEVKVLHIRGPGQRPLRPDEL